MRIFFIIFSGIIFVLSFISVVYIVIRYEINRRQDKKKEAQGIYIKRVTRAETLLCLFIPMFPCLAFIANIQSENVNIWANTVNIIFVFFCYLYARYVFVAYVKLSPEGIEQRVWSANPTRYPINAIDSVVYYETLNVEDQDTVGFYTRSGKQIAAFGPMTHKSYRLLAIVRFRIEQERWPDMNNPADVAQVDKLDNGYMTIPYFRSREKVTGLAEVDM